MYVENFPQLEEVIGENEDGGGVWGVGCGCGRGRTSKPRLQLRMALQLWQQRLVCIMEITVYLGHIL